MPMALRGSSTTRGSGLIYVLTTIYVIACVFLILVVLLQSGKGGDVAAAFGGAGSQTAFGPRGAQKPLEKATVVAAALFMLLALLFSLPGMNGPRSVVSERPATQASPTPAPSNAPAAATSPSPSSSQQPSPSPAKK
jgi:preprotein translocase subunit SecG